MVAGIGLFLLGIRILSVNINKAAGFAFQRFSCAITSGVRASVFWGMLSGFVTQSSRTLSVLFASLVRGGIMAPSESFVFLNWSNVGCLFILFAAVFPFRDASFVFMGLAGFMYSIGKPPKFIRVYSIMVAVGLALFGLSIVSEYAGSVVDFPEVRRLFEHANNSPLLALAAGFVLVIATQSYPAMVLIIISMSGGVLHWDTAMHIAMGVHLGSSANAYFVGFDFKGRARQCIFCVFYYYVVLAALFYAFWFVFDLLSPESLGAVMRRAFSSEGGAVAAAIVAANLAAAVVLTFFQGCYARFIARISPELGNEHSGRPKFIAVSSLDNPPLALDLASSEHMRLIRRLPGYLALLRYRNFEALAGEGLAFLSVRSRLHEYLDEIVKRADSAAVMERAVDLKQRDDSSVQIMETLMKFSEKLAKANLGRAAWDFVDRILGMSEDIVAAFEASIENPSKENLESFLGRNKDFEARVAEVQNDFLKDDGGLSLSERGVLLRISGIYERFAWLLYRYAVSVYESGRGFAAK